VRASCGRRTSRPSHRSGSRRSRRPWARSSAPPQALGLYEATPGQVIHHPSLKGGELEQQLLAFPTASVHDDLVDALRQALILFEQAHYKRPSPKPRQLSYVG
jgi:hypothetical protein